MRVLGVDPGTLKMGWGIVSGNGHEISHEYSDTIVAPRATQTHHRLWAIFQELDRIVGAQSLDAVAVEATFVGTNPKTALVIAQARTVVTLVAGKNGVPYFEYSPAEIKRAVASDGRAEKEAVKLSICAILRVESDITYDQADALACAICHLNNAQQNALLARARE